MIYTLYGSDTYRSRQKLNEIIQAYRNKSQTDADFHRFDAEDHNLSELQQIMQTSSLFNPKKFVVVDYAFSGRMEAMIRIASNWQHAKNQHLMLYHGSLDASAKKYLKLWKPFITQSQEFEELKGSPKHAWIRKEAVGRGVALSDNDVHYIASVSSDSWSIIQEIEKRAVGKTIKNNLTIIKHPTIFDLGDIFFTDRKRALGMLQYMLAMGEDEFGLFSYLANRARSLVAIKQCMQHNKSVPSWLGIHPFVAKKTAQLARALTLRQCAFFVMQFFEEDWHIKVGISQPKDALIRILTGRL